MHVKVIVNPAAGRGRVLRRIHEVLTFLKKNADVDLEESRDSEHLVELGRTASTGGFDRVVVCGGDGTVHHVIRQFDLARGTLAVIPLGSGDDFAATAGVPMNRMRAAAAALSSRIREVDVAEANGERFVIAASVGFDAKVARYASSVRRIRGPAVYLYSLFKVLRHFQPVRLSVDGREGDFMFAVVANSYRYGGGIRIAPAAIVDDGLLDLYTIAVCSRVDLLMTLPLAYIGKHTIRRFVRSRRGAEFTIGSELPMEIFADGEFLTTTPARFRILPQRLRVAVP